MRGFWKSLPVDYHTYALIALVLLSTVLVLMAKWMSRKQPTMTRKRKKLLLDQQEFVKSVVKAKKVELQLRSESDEEKKLLSPSLPDSPVHFIFCENACTAGQKNS